DRARLLETLARLVTPDEVRRILIVDDEEISRYVLRQHLWQPHVIVAEAASGREALDRIAHDLPDGLFLDIGLPDMTGHDLLAILRSDPKTRELPIVIVTAAVLDDAEHRSLHELANGVISKAVLSRERALTALDAALATSGGGAAR